MQSHVIHGLSIFLQNGCAQIKQKSMNVKSFPYKTELR